MITKGPERNSYRVRVDYFPRARDAFASYLREKLPKGDGCVLLPSYIGWSAREGSGVCDPIKALGLQVRFYRLDGRLRIDLADLERQLDTGEVSLLLLVHYFGRPDPHAADAAATARARGIGVVEDEAHSMLTHLVVGTSGRLGDASIFSVHKLLPTGVGGILLRRCEPREAPHQGPPPSWQPWSYDLQAIAVRRQRNWALLRAGLLSLKGRIEPLWGGDEECAGLYVPQTLPVVVRRGSRNDIYHTLNRQGFGVVSLSHTLVPDISKAVYPETHGLSTQVLNLPVHQDVSEEDLRQLLEKLDELTRDGDDSV